MSIKCSAGTGGKLRRHCGREAAAAAGGVAAWRSVAAAARRPRLLWAALIKFMATSPLKQY